MQISLIIYLESISTKLIIQFHEYVQKSLNEIEIKFCFSDIFRNKKWKFSKRKCATKTAAIVLILLESSNNIVTRIEPAG